MAGALQTARDARERGSTLAGFLGNQQPLTIKRLRELKPGQTLIYYRGHFAFDLDRSERASPYRDLLIRIRETAQNLAQNRLVELSEVRRLDAKGAVFYDYVATGV